MKLCVKCGGTPTRATRRGMCHNCYQNWWSRRHGYGTFESLYVDAAPVRQHIQALLDAGMSKRRIAETAGVAREALRRITNGRADRGTGPSERVLETIATKILALTIPAVAPHDAVAAGALVDAVGTIRRCQALVAWGYSRTEIGRRIGWSVTNMGSLLDPATGRVRAETARKVDAVFRELQHTPGTCVRARNEGQRKGWTLPFDWDEDQLDRFVIADHTDHAPAAAPEPLSFPERYEELRHLGFGVTEIAHRLDIRLSSLERALERYGLPISAELRVLARDERTIRKAS